MAGTAIMVKKFLVYLILGISSNSLASIPSLWSIMANSNFKNAIQSIPEASFVTITEVKKQKNDLAMIETTIKKEYVKIPKESLESFRKQRDERLRAYISKNYRTINALSLVVALASAAGAHIAKNKYNKPLPFTCACGLSLLGGVVLPFITHHFGPSALLRRRHVPTPVGGSSNCEYYLVSTGKERIRVIHQDPAEQ